MKKRIEDAVKQLDFQANELKHIVNTSFAAIVIPQTTVNQESPNNKSATASIGKGALVVGAVSLACGIAIPSKFLGIAGILLAGFGGASVYKTSKQIDRINGVEKIDFTVLSQLINDKIFKVKDVISENWDKFVFELTQHLKKFAKEYDADRADKVIETITETSIIEISALDINKQIRTAIASKDERQIKECLGLIKDEFNLAIDNACRKQIEIYRRSL